MENYEQKYKKGLSFLKDLKSHMSDYCIEKLEGFFPELRESEDERNQRIKKEVIEMLHYYHSKSPCFIPPQFSLEETLAWLEKQGKKEEINEASYRTGIKRVLDNPESYGLEKQGEQKSACSEDIAMIQNAIYWINEF